METQLFIWENWDDQGDFCLSFHPVTLKVSVGKFRPGEKFDVAFLNFQKGELQLGDNTHDGYVVRGEYKLNLTVGEIVKE
jgi:hypothetical protein